MDTSREDTSQKTTSTPQTDDESITTSTESDSLETWTLVNGKNTKNKRETSAREENQQDTNDRIEKINTFDESLTTRSKEIHESADSRTDDDSIVDDVSEGISIISESDSAGRASPLAIAENLNSIDLDNYPNIGNVTPASMLRLPIHLPQSTYSAVQPLEENTLRQRRVKRSSSNTITERRDLKLKQDSVVDANLVYPLVRRGLKGAFFICAALAILAFIGKLRNPDWQPFFDSKNLAVMEQKLTELELQNNLMRAEIDILSKQVNYLSDLKEKGEREPKQQQRLFKQTGEWIMKQKGKTFKAWPGNGDSLDPVHITKDELKKPYKCPNGKFVEIANMCIEKSPENINSVEDILNLNVEDIVVEEIIEGMKSLKREASGADDADHANLNKQGRRANKIETKDDEENKKKYFSNTESRNSKEHENHSSEKNYETRKHWKQHKHLHAHSNERDNDGDFSEEDDDDDGDDDFDDSLEDFDKKKFTSKEKFRKRESESSEGSKYNDRHFKKRQYNDRSKERHFNSNSKENIYAGSGEQSRKSGEWHAKLMQQRENARLQNEYRQRNKNWFIERGDSREKMRHRR